MALIGHTGDLNEAREASKARYIRPERTKPRAPFVCPASSREKARRIRNRFISRVPGAGVALSYPWYKALSESNNERGRARGSDRLYVSLSPARHALPDSHRESKSPWSSSSPPPRKETSASCQRGSRSRFTRVFAGDSDHIARSCSVHVRVSERKRSGGRRRSRNLTFSVINGYTRKYDTTQSCNGTARCDGTR